MGLETWIVKFITVNYKYINKVKKFENKQQAVIITA